MHRTWMTVGIVLTLTAFATTSRAQTSLRWQFAPGQQLHQTTVQNMTSSAAVAGQTVNSTMTQTTDAVWSVGQVDNQGTAEVELKVTRIRMKVTGLGGINIDIDSDSAEAPAGFAAALAGPLKAMANASFTVKMNSSGEMLDAKASKETVAALQGLGNAAQMGGVFSEEGLINVIRQGAPVLAKNPVRVGDTWDSALQLKLPQVGALDTKTTMTYAGPVVVEGRQLEKIDLDIQMMLQPPAANAQIRMEITKQSAKGAMYFDNQAGRLTRTELAQNMTMQISAAGRQFEQSIVQDIKVTMVPVN